MKIALIVDHLEETRGGAERCLHDLGARLALRGHDVNVYCVHGRAPPGAALHTIPVRGLRAARERRFARRAVEMARAHQCAILGVRHLLEADVYQPHGGTFAAAHEARLALQPDGWRRRVRELGDRWSPKHRYFLEADRAIFELNPSMITAAPSPLVRDDILRRYGSARPRVEVVWPAVDSRRFHPGLRKSRGIAFRRRMGIPENLQIGLFVGHDFLLKGLGVALRAWLGCRAGAKLGHLLIAGRGAIDRFRALADRLGLRGRTWWLGDRSDIAELFGASDVLIQPTHFDPCSLATLEALACGVPVVSSGRNGARHWLQQGGGRVVEDPADEAGFAAAIDEVLGDGARLSGQAAAIGAAFEWDEHVARIESLLAEASAARSHA